MRKLLQTGVSHILAALYWAASENGLRRGLGDLWIRSHTWFTLAPC
ncbi:hypothetical protein [Xanthomonas graminis]|nr:hypothetical protein [Xanthomonas translucens]